MEAEAVANHRKGTLISMVYKRERTKRILRKIDACENFLPRESELADLLLTKYNTVINLWEDSQRLKLQEASPYSKMVTFLEERGWPHEYTAEELQEKYLLLDWIATNLVFERPIKSRQLFVYGPPSTQKTLLMSLLKKGGLRQEEDRA